jgi:hypothetical protein
MVELAPPSARRPSVSSLRQISSNPNLKGGRPNISGPIGPPVPLSLDGDGGSAESPARPGTAGSIKKDWVNPLDVHFAKDMPFANSGKTKSTTTSFPKSPLAQTEFKLDTNVTSLSAGIGNFDIGPSGYPSPPQSVKSNDTPNSPEMKPQIQTSRPSAPSGLRRVNTAEQTQLPSPATSEDRGDGLMIRNGNAKRETMMGFHAPRRAEEPTQRKQWKDRTDQEREAIKKRRQTEGFEGNFSAFNFGGAPVDTSVPLPTASPESTLARLDSPSGSKETASSIDKRSTGDSVRSESVTSRDTYGDGKPAEKPIVKPLDPWTDALPRIPSEMNGHRSYAKPSFDSLHSRSVHARGDSDTRAPGTPTALRSTVEQPSAVSSPPQRGRAVEQFDAPPKLNPDRRSQSPLRSKGPMEGDFPVSKGLPRGRRPTITSITTQSSTAPMKAPVRPPREDEDSAVLPSWADRAERHLSAIPAPLTPLGTSPNLRDTDISPWASKTTTSSPIAPRLPSPTFPSLEKSVSAGSDNLTAGLGLSFGEEIANSLSHHMLTELSPTSGDAGRRVQKRTAPPRPPPITLPPGKNGSTGMRTPTGSMKSPVASEFSAGFI